MEYLLERESADLCETLSDSVCEQPVDIDISLPDYCPDIERILKCRLCPQVSSAAIVGDRLDVDGVSVVRVWYLDSRKQSIRLCEQTVPFSCSFELKGDPDGAVPCVRIKSDYINCRAVSPRKLDIHGAFSVGASVYGRGTRDYCTGINAPDVQQQTSAATVSSLRGMTRQQFSLSEVLDIGKGKSTPEMILRSELTFTKGDCRAIDDKLMLRGEATLRVLYVTDIETGARDAMSFSIPVSQVIDVQGISDSTLNDISVEIMSCDVSLKSEYDENSTLISLDARLCACVFAYEERELTLITDAYSTDYELDTERSSCSVSRLLRVEDITLSLRDEMKTGDSNITRVVDLWCDGISSICSSGSGVLNIKGKLTVSLFALDGDGVPFCCEKAVDFSTTVECPDDGMTYTARTDIAAPSPSYRITGDNCIEIKADVVISAAIYGEGSMRCITSVSADDDRKKQRDEAAALTIYYAGEGESLWDIARSYCTSVEAIRNENRITGDTASRGMLLIPM